MTIPHPIISITGSSGAGTTSVKRIFELIFRREKVAAAFIEGDAFHKYDRLTMKQKIAEEDKKGNSHFSHFHPDANELDEASTHGGADHSVEDLARDLRTNDLWPWNSSRAA